MLVFVSAMLYLIVQGFTFMQILLKEVGVRCVGHPGSCFCAVTLTTGKLLSPQLLPVFTGEPAVS